jgi:hypothetical protein
MPPGPEAHAEFAGCLGVACRHECRSFLVVNEHEPHPVLLPAQAFHDAVDPVTRDTEGGIHAPVGYPLDDCL